MAFLIERDLAEFYEMAAARAMGQAQEASPPSATPSKRATRFQAAETIDASDAQVGVRARFTPRINAMSSGGMAGWKVSCLP